MSSEACEKTQKPTKPNCAEIKKNNKKLLTNTEYTNYYIILY